MAYSRCQANWGGATFGIANEQFVADDADCYIFAVSDTTEVKADADFTEFSEAIDKAIASWLGDIPYIGFFHDNVKGTIDINVSMVVDTREDVDLAYSLGAIMVGGAYNPRTGNGYWPKGRPVEYTE
jgi:hypothetical protein